jgi:dipeptidyl aminopeptidase/acylaminoacyl peptidase
MSARILISLVTAVVFTAPAVQAAPLELYGRLPNLEDVSLSPDGSKIAFVRTTADVRALAVVSMADSKLLGGLKIGEVKVREVQWADDDHLLITISSTSLPPIGFIGPEREFYGLESYEISTRQTTSLPIPLKDVFMMNVLSGTPMVSHLSGDTVVFVPGVYVSGGRTLPGLFRADLRTHAEKMVRDGNDSTVDWLVNDTGEIVASQSWSDHDRHWAISGLRDGHTVELASGTADVEYPHLLGLGPRDDSLLVSSMEGGDPVWRFLSLKDGKMGEPLAERATLHTPIEDPRTHRMIGGIGGPDGLRYTFFDPQRQAQWESIVQRFPDQQVRLICATDDFTRLVVQVHGRKLGYLYVLVDLNTGKFGKLGEVYEGLGIPLEVRRIVYPASDGLRIPAFLTLPDGKPPTKLPLVVLPHGGPGEHDTSDFDWMSQGIASQGYAVLQPNFRGSNLTWSFQSAGFGQLGRKMQTDLSDGVRALVKEGIVDPARVCIMGASYGGYAALAGVTLDTGVYRCAISISGVSDLAQQLRWQNDRNNRSRRTERYWDRYTGANGPDDPVLATISPLRHVDAVTVPVLLIHGKDDTVVPYLQSEAMHAALKKANKPVEFVTLKREDHWLSRSETRLQMLEASVAFLKAHNPPN